MVDQAQKEDLGTKPVHLEAINRLGTIERILVLLANSSPVESVGTVLAVAFSHEGQAQNYSGGNTDASFGSTFGGGSNNGGSFAISNPSPFSTNSGGAFGSSNSSSFGSSNPFGGGNSGGFGSSPFSSNTSNNNPFGAPRR